VARVRGFRDQACAYFEAMLRLAERLVEPLGRGLGLDVRYLSERRGQPVSLLRMINYEGCAPGDDDERIRPHTDFELLTIISETSPGFELCDRAGRWHRTVTADASELLVLAGDLLEIVTAGRVESPLHRVRPGRERRSSMVFFFGLNADAVIEPQLPAAPGREGSYGATVVGHHLARQILSCPSLRAQHVAGSLLGDLPLRSGNPCKAYKVERAAAAPSNRA
jgi:isopenicillin N synthase-like dioxygenase